MYKTMSFANDLTSELWRNFMPRKNEITHCINLISMQKYPESFDFNPNVMFKKWAAAEVSEFSEIPQGMDEIIVPEGLYAVFHYKGLNMDSRIFQYIFTQWLPQSQYLLDNNRMHYEILGDKYKNNDPTSEEDIYIPIRNR